MLKNIIGLHDWETHHAPNLKLGKGFAKDLESPTHKHVWQEEPMIRMQAMQIRGLLEGEMRRLWQDWKNSSLYGWCEGLK